MKLTGVVVIVLIALWTVSSAGCGTSKETATSSSSNAPETSATRSEEPEASEEEGISGDTPTATSILDGTWKKGEYQPGTYRAPGGESCKWEQRQKPGGEASGEGFNENYGYGETNVLIEINSPYFFTEECGIWKKVGSEAGGETGGDTPTATSIPDGTWKKGEYQPGTYRAPGGESCKWEQRQKPGGEASGEGFNENYGYGETNVLIEINSPYFFTEECGIWKKIGG